MTNSADPDQFGFFRSQLIWNTLFTKAEYIQVQQDKGN